MRHKFPKNEIPQGHRSIDQICMICDCRSILYDTGARMYRSSSGRIIAKAPQCVGSPQVHQFPEVIIPEGAREITQTCLICGKNRVVYASGSRAYFDEVTGARISYVSACSTEAAVIHISKAVSIPKFVDHSQVGVDGGIMHEMYVMLYLISEVGLTEKTKHMVDDFLQAHRQKPFAKAN